MNVDNTGPEAAAAEQPLGSDVVALLVEHHRAFRAFLEKRVGRRLLIFPLEAREVYG